MTRLAVLGATGAVGETLLKVLEEREFPLAELRLLASERSAGQTRRFRGEDVEVQLAGGRLVRRHRHRHLLGRRRPLAHVRTARGRRRRRRDRQLLGLPHGCRRAAGRARGEPAGGVHPRRRDREPELLDDAARAGAEAAARRRRPRARDRLDLPGGLGHRPEGDRRAAPGGCERAARRRGERRGLRAPDRVQRAAVRRRAAGRRRLHGRGAEARQRVAQDPRHPRAAGVGDLRARAR